MIDTIIVLLIPIAFLIGYLLGHLQAKTFRIRNKDDKK